MSITRLSTANCLFPAVVAVALLPMAADAQRAGQSVTVQTGRVVGAQAVNLQSAAGPGVAVGGTLGYALTWSNQRSSRTVRDTIPGAAAGGIMSSRGEGSLDGI